jgi:hypothetical protein
MILRVLRLEVSVYNVYITNKTENRKKKNSEDFCPNYVQELGLWSVYSLTYRIRYRHCVFLESIWWGRGGGVVEMYL